MPQPWKEEPNLGRENQALLTRPSPIVTDSSSTSKTSQYSNGVAAERSYRLLNEAKSAADLLKRGGKARMSESHLIHGQHDTYQTYSDEEGHIPQYIGAQPSSVTNSSWTSASSPNYSLVKEFFEQIPAIIIGTVLGIVVGIPFAAGLSDALHYFYTVIVAHKSSIHLFTSLPQSTRMALLSL